MVIERVAWVIVACIFFWQGYKMGFGIGVGTEKKRMGRLAADAQLRAMNSMRFPFWGSGASMVCKVVETTQEGENE